MARQHSLLLAAFVVAAVSVALGAADDPPIRWLVNYDGKGIPAEPVWKAEGQPEAQASDKGLLLVDTLADSDGLFRASWKPEPGTEVVVEARLLVNSTGGAVKAKPDSLLVWPWRDGAPVSVLVSDGLHQEGLTFCKDHVNTWTDRTLLTDTKSDFHTYRLVIRGTDMSVAVDGVVKLEGQNAFWKPASGEAFIQFGSSSKVARGDAIWQSVRLGVRQASPPPAAALKVTVSEPWAIKRPDLKTKPTRPYIYNLGQGRLAMSQAQGPDALFEPYGVALSSDEGKTWEPVKGLDVTEFAPLPILRLKDGSVLGMSRWTWPQPDGSYVARTVRWDAGLANFASVESRLHMPAEYCPHTVPFTCERHAFQENDGAVLMAGYSKTGPSTADGTRAGRRYSHLLRSTDGGQEWQHFAVIGPGGEPAVVRTGGGKMTAVLRMGPFRPLVQVFSADDGKTWSPPTLMEVGSVCPDLVMMSNGLLACSYGRPASCLMFSADGGHSWISHHVISEKAGFNYSGIVEVRPGRLLYLHDGGGLQGVYVDVARVAP